MVLEHHLIVADRVFSMGDLRNMSHDSLILPTVGLESLQIRVKEEDNSKLGLGKSPSLAHHVIHVCILSARRVLHPVEGDGPLDDSVPCRCRMHQRADPRHRCTVRARVRHDHQRRPSPVRYRAADTAAGDGADRTRSGLEPERKANRETLFRFQDTPDQS